MKSKKAIHEFLFCVYVKEEYTFIAKWFRGITKYSMPNAIELIVLEHILGYTIKDSN